jgi:hypothetical protein
VLLLLLLLHGVIKYNNNKTVFRLDCIGIVYRIQLSNFAIGA